MDDRPSPPDTTLAQPVAQAPRWDSVLRRIFRRLAIFCALVLTLLYLLVGDRSPWGEFLTIWPPVLWLAGLIPLAALGSTRTAKRGTLIAWGTVLLFVGSTHDVRPLLRSFSSASSEKAAFRVVTWNIGGTTDMDAIARDLQAMNPDICILQEYRASQHREGLEPFAKLWPVTHMEQSGELVILSRYPFTLLPSRSVGPWSDPQLAWMEFEGGRTLLLANVRLMLPSLVLNPLGQHARATLINDNTLRVAQYPKLAVLLSETREREKPTAVLLGGDFNTSGHATSLAPIHEILDDSWPLAGRGWGGSCTTEFPVARIDMMHVSSGIVPLRAEVGSSRTSDHRPLIAEFRWVGSN